MIKIDEIKKGDEVNFTEHYTSYQHLFFLPREPRENTSAIGKVKDIDRKKRMVLIQPTKYVMVRDTDSVTSVTWIKLQDIISVKRTIYTR